MLIRSLFSLFFALHAFAAEPPGFQADFQQAELGKLPQGWAVIAGGFRVQEEGGQRFLELPGAPLDTFSVLFGPAQSDGMMASAKAFGTKTGRKFPTFAVSLGGGGGYRLQVSPGKKSLEIFKGDESRVSVPYEWTSGEWMVLKIQLRKAGEKWVIEGKAWPVNGSEPVDWTISTEEASAPPMGRAGLWGSPFSGTPIRFDDVFLALAAP